MHASPCILDGDGTREACFVVCCLRDGLGMPTTTKVTAAYIYPDRMPHTYGVTMHP